MKELTLEEEMEEERLYNNKERIANVKPILNDIVAGIKR